MPRLALVPREQGWTLLEKALYSFRSKEILSSVDFNALSAELRAQAGALSGVWNTRFTAALYSSLEDALATGTSASDWLPEASKLIQAYGGARALGIYGPDVTGESMSAWYSDLVFRMATTNALNAGRYSEMFYGPAFESDPFWLFATAEDERVCPICEPLDGQVFPKDDAEGQQYLPPLHFGSCRCQAIQLNAAGVAAGGYKVSSGRDVGIELPEGFGSALDLVPAALRRAA